MRKIRTNKRAYAKVSKKMDKERLEDKKVHAKLRDILLTRTNEDFTPKSQAQCKEILGTFYKELCKLKAKDNQDATSRRYDFVYNMIEIRAALIAGDYYEACAECQKLNIFHDRRQKRILMNLQKLLEPYIF